MVTNSVYIDPINVINKQIFESIQDVAICSICTGVVIDAQQCSKCENCFCKNCIIRWTDKSNTCPYKCNEWTLKEATRVVKSILNRLFILCPKNCNEQVKYSEIISHVNECSSNVINCPTCGSQVNEEAICRESYNQLKIENKILKRKIEDLEFLSLSVKDNKNNFNNFEQKSQSAIPHKKLSKFPHKKQNQIFIHDNNSKSKFRFVCCNKEYDCADCHNEHETHQYYKASSITCQECSYVSTIISDSVCGFCGVNFKETSKASIDVIKYKNNNSRKGPRVLSSNEEVSLNSILNSRKPYSKISIKK